MSSTQLTVSIYEKNELGDENDSCESDECDEFADGCDMFTFLPLNIYSCILLNQTYQQNILDCIYFIETKLEANRRMQIELRNDAQSTTTTISTTLSTKAGCKHPNSIIPFLAPYFKDVKGLHPPQNHDVKMKRFNGEINQAMISANKPWTEEEKSQLKILVEQQSKRLLLDPLCRSKEIKAIAIRNEPNVKKKKQYEEEIEILNLEIDRMNNKKLEEVAPPREASDRIDWLSISVLLQQSKQISRSYLACELIWTNYLHPDINQKAWTEKEDDKLKQLISESGTNWEQIAENLGTNRLAWQCFCRYQSELNDKMKRMGPLSKAEAKKVEEIVSQLRIGNFIPWQQVNYFIDGRKSSQIKHYWNKINLLKRGESWNELEDKVLTAAVTKYGKSNWRKVAQFLPGRTNRQCRERYTLRLGVKERKIGNYSIEEDKLIVKYAKQFNYKWVEIEKRIEGRNAKQIANRFEFLIKCFRKIDFDVEDPSTEDEDLPIKPVTRKIYLKPKNCRRVKEGMIRFFGESAVEGCEDIDSILYLGKQQLRQELEAEIRNKERNEFKGRPRKTEEESEVENQILAMLSAYSYFQSNVRGQTKLHQISVQDQYVSDEVKKCLTSILKVDVPQTSHLLSKVTNAAISSGVIDFSDIQNTKFSHVIPPNRPTVRGFQALTMLRPYLMNEITDLQYESSEESIEISTITNDPVFKRLFQQYLSIFFWPTLLTLQSPPHNVSTITESRAKASNAVYLSKIRDKQKYLIQTAENYLSNESNDCTVYEVESESTPCYFNNNDETQASTSNEQIDQSTETIRRKSKRQNYAKNAISKRRKKVTE